MKSRCKMLQASILGVVLLYTFSSSAQPVTKIAAGYGHSLFIRSDGSLWAMGYDQYGQLGDGVTNRLGTDGSIPYFSTNLPEMIVASNVIAIAAGEMHSLLLMSDGSLWDMGNNDAGELGNGSTSDHTYFTNNRPGLIVASNVTAIAAGDAHSLFLKSDGSSWAMGDNGYGELGDGTYSFYTNLPEMIVASNVTAIAGSFHTMFIKSDGSLWVTGRNFDGELGDGAYGLTNQPEMIVASNVTAVAAGEFHSLFIKSDGSLWGMGPGLFIGDGANSDTNQPQMIVASNVTAIAAGWEHSLFIKSDGSLWAMGDNEYGQLGDGTYNSTNRPEMIVPNGVKAIAAGVGPGHSLFIKTDGSLWGMGYNYYGQLGNGMYRNNVNQPVMIVPGIPGFNKISGQPLASGDMQLSFVGVAGANYALDRATSLSPANWISVITNAASSSGAVTFTNTPDTTTNNFWRIRSVL